MLAPFVAHLSDKSRLVPSGSVWINLAPREAELSWFLGQVLRSSGVLEIQVARNFDGATRQERDHDTMMFLRLHPWLPALIVVALTCLTVFFRCATLLIGLLATLPRASQLDTPQIFQAFASAASGQKGNHGPSGPIALSEKTPGLACLSPAVRGRHTTIVRPAPMEQTDKDSLAIWRWEYPNAN